MAQERLEEIRARRLAIREQLLATGKSPYPAEAQRTHTLADVVATFETLQNAKENVVVVGRVTGKREHGGVVFLDLTDASGNLQLQLSRNQVPADVFAELVTLDTGDFIQASGTLGASSRGVQTLQVLEWHLLSKSIRPLPTQWYGLKDQETRLRQRELDFLMNEQARAVVTLRAEVLGWLRQQLNQAGFIEVETPILQPVPGGAAAEPFTTHHHALDADLYLRIAPELYLKRLLVGGFEKVFEIGKNFRNEGIDREHNPEFTMLELYWAYADYEDLMDFTEGLLGRLVHEVTGEDTLPTTDGNVMFALPWRRERYVDLVSSVLGIDILTEKDPAVYEELLQARQLEVPGVRTYAKLVDTLYKEVVRPTLVQPTLLFDYPVEVAPLAKQNLTDPRIAEKFQLVVTGTELVNAYTELNDPVEQRRRFEEQQAARAQGDREAHPLDEGYLEALELGMPPAAGWGLGIDRVVALLGQLPHVRDTITFPLLKAGN